MGYNLTKIPTRGYIYYTGRCRGITAKDPVSWPYQRSEKVSKPYLSKKEIGRFASSVPEPKGIVGYEAVAVWGVM